MWSSSIQYIDLNRHAFRGMLQAIMILSNKRIIKTACIAFQNWQGCTQHAIKLVMLTLQLVGGDPDKDIAVLQLECETSKIEEFKPISLGQSSNLLVGQKVYAIGNPFGLDHTLTQGIVSGVGRELNTPGMLYLVSITAAGADVPPESLCTSKT